MNRNIAVVALLVFIAVAAALAGRARAHDIYHDWKIPGTTTSCCHDEDCRPTVAEIREDAWWAVVNGEWVRIPDNLVLKIPSPDGRSHVCASPHRMIYCFVPGEVRG